MIADDHPLYRDGVARAISERPDLHLVGQAADGWGALFLITKLRPDVALVDLKMPGVDGIELCSRLREARPLSRTRIVLLSAYLDAEIVSLARSAGAAGYLSKDGSREVICSTLLRLGREPDALHGGDRTGARGERME